MKILLSVAYDGANYCGWQRQRNGISVQQVLEEKGLFPVFSEAISVLGASRTDAGVHALDQKAGFDIEDGRLKIPIGKLPLVINRTLPPDVVVAGAQTVPDDFHPIFDAKKKTYEYVIYNSAYPNPKLANYCEHVWRPLDFGKMSAAAEFFVGKHDFAAFRAAGASSKTTARTIFDIGLKKDGAIISLSVSGNGFLYNMVRIIAGTLIDVGTGRIEPGDISGIILSKKRENAGRTASAKGLTLMRVEY